MANIVRLTHLDTGSVLLLGVERKADLTELNLAAEDQTQSGRGISEIDEDTVIVKSAFTITGSLLSNDSTEDRVSTLKTTAYALTAAGVGTPVSYLGDMKRGTLDVAIGTDDGSAGGDQWSEPHAVSRSISGTGELLVSNTAAFMATMALPPPQRKLTFGMTIGPTAFEIPVVLTGDTHTIERSRVQYQTLRYGQRRGTPTCTGNTLLANAIAGSASGAFSIDTGAGVYTCDGGFVATALGLGYGDGELLTSRITLAAFGKVVPA